MTRRTPSTVRLPPIFKPSLAGWYAPSGAILTTLTVILTGDENNAYKYL
jgi:hypothetical protein